MANESDSESSEDMDAYYGTDESITMEWLIENEYNKYFWKKVRQSGTRFSNFRDKSHKRKAEYKSAKNLLGSNKRRIQQIYDNHILSAQDLTKAISNPECKLITNLNIPNDIILSIVSYVGNGMIPICYKLSYLPFFRAIREHKLYRNTLKQWWKTVIQKQDHRGVFYPTSLKSAALEFQRYFTEKLSQNGIDASNSKRVKYHRYMVPTIMMELDASIMQQKCCEDIGLQAKDKAIAVRLPTASGSSACIGGIELFQRLYLETVVNPQYADAFNVDLMSVDGNHGDNWCFDGNANVLMADMTHKQVSALQIGDCVRSFPGNATAEVKCVIVSNINKEIEMVQLKNNCWITFEHPVLIQNDANMYNCNIINVTDDISNKLHSDVIHTYNLCWVLPKHILPVQYRYQEKIYNFVLDRNHTLNVNGNWCCTLGHDYKGECIEHEFWGNSTVIHKFLKQNSATYPYVVFDKRIHCV